MGGVHSQTRGNKTGSKGQKIGQYIILDTIGQGAEAVVYTVKEIETGDRYVLKALRPSIQHPRANPESITQLMRNIAHPSIVALKECFSVTVDGVTPLKQACIVMEYCSGGDLWPKIQQLQHTGIYLPEEWLMKWLIQLIEGLHYMHEKNVVHRDMKPQNCFLSKDYDVKIGDFGVSTVLEESDSAHTFVGTHLYMAPEMFMPKKDLAYGPAVDMFALGCIAYELTTPKFLLEQMKVVPGWAMVRSARYNKNDGDVNVYEKKAHDKLVSNMPPSCPAEYKRVVLGMLRANPNTRYTAAQLLKDPYILKWKEKFATEKPQVQQLLALFLARSFRLYGMGPRIFVCMGDMLHEKVDAIVVTQDSLFSFNGGLSKALLQIAPSQKEDLQKKLKKLSTTGSLPMAKPVVVKINPKDKKAKDISFNSVIHVSAPAATTPNYYEWLMRTFMECLKTAIGKKMATISFSAVGTGGGGITADECARAFFEVATSWKGAVENLSEVRLVCIDLTTLKAFNEAYDKQILKLKEE